MKPANEGHFGSNASARVSHCMMCLHADAMDDVPCAKDIAEQATRCCVLRASLCTTMVSRAHGWPTRAGRPLTIRTKLKADAWLFFCRAATMQNSVATDAMRRSLTQSAAHGIQVRVQPGETHLQQRLPSWRWCLTCLCASSLGFALRG